MAGKPVKRPVISFILRWIVGAVLIVAGCIKLRDPLAFRLAIESFGLFPHWLAVGIAVTLPPFELICGILLLFDIRKHAMTLAATILMSLFTLATAWAAWRGIDCGCFGSLRIFETSPWASVLRNIVLLAIAAHLLHRSRVHG